MPDPIDNPGLTRLTPKEQLVLDGVKDGGRALTGPFGVQIGVTNYCNYACEFCGRFSYRNAAMPNAFYQLERDIFLRLVEDASRMEVEQISIAGVGEPLLHRDILAFVEEVKKHGIECKITSNGALLTDQMADGLLSAGLDFLNISLNAASEATYETMSGPGRAKAFPKLLEAIKRLSGNKAKSGKEMRLTLRYLVNRRNAEELEPFAEFAIEADVDEVVFQNYVAPAVAIDAALDGDERASLGPRLADIGARLAENGVTSNAGFIGKLYSGNGSAKDDAGAPGFDYYRRKPCLVGWTYIVIMENGDARPCCYCGEPLGNINETSFSEIWFSERYGEFRKKALTLPSNQEDIRNCSCFTACGSIRDNIRTEERLGLR